MSVRLECEHIDGVLIVRVLLKRIRYDDSEEVAAQIRQAIDIYQANKVVLDLAEAEYMTSEMLGRIVGLLKAVADKQGELKLVLRSKKVLEVFKMTNLDKILDIHKEASAAIKAF